MDDTALLSGNGGEEEPNEVEINLGNIRKPLNVNILPHFDELLKDVMSVDQEGQRLQDPSSSSSLHTTPTFLGNFGSNNGPLLSSKKKSMDEVWNEMVHHDHPINLNTATENGSSSLHHQRMITIDQESTPPQHLLVRAGILNPSRLMPIDHPPAGVSQQADWFQFQLAAAAQQQMTMLNSNFKICESVFDNSSPAMHLDNFSDAHRQVGGGGLAMPISAASSSSESQVTHVEKTRSYPDEMKEKSIERRQRRMIKNRESAARSRARKQAYTNQLESEVFHLRKMNTWLKKQKEVELHLSSNLSNSIPKYQLRRTSSAPF